ncbi:MAG: flagellar basal body rod C-terminal domain-containing protein, partial [Pseudomonadota bacterium]
MYLWDAGDGPTGSTVGFSREQSTTDIAGELTSLIETQRAYSSNAKIIQTVDEMLQETTNIKR